MRRAAWRSAGSGVTSLLIPVLTPKLKTTGCDQQTIFSTSAANSLKCETDGGLTFCFGETMRALSMLNMLIDSGEVDFS